MSDYHREKVLRIPFEGLNLNPASFRNADIELHDMFGDMFYCGGQRVGKFDIAPTTRAFIDFILESEYGSECGEWGKVRQLTSIEQEKYAPVFKKLCETVDMDKVHLVEFCWYNCCEAPGYYSLDKALDPFYDELPFICSFSVK